MQIISFSSALVAFLGLLAAVLQTAALRSFLSVFAGNELVMAIALGLWLAAAGGGSMAGRRIRSSSGLGVVVLVAGFLSQLPAFLPLVRTAASLAPGETVPLGATIGAALLALGPLCFAIGLQFPLAVRQLKGNGAAAYGLEAFGAVLGGALYTFLLAGLVPGPVVLTAAGAAYMIIGASLLRKPTALLGITVPAAVFMAMVQLGPAPDASASRPLVRKESRYGAIEVYRSRGQADVYAAGKLQFSYPDPETEEMRAHLAATLHPHPRRVLLLGGSPAVGRELLRYPEMAVDFVELDPELISIATAILDDSDRAAFTVGRWTAFPEDGRRFIRQRGGGPYDLVILNAPAPATAGLNRYWTIEFFRELRGVLAPGGVVALSIPPSYGYVGTKMQAASGALYQALHRTFSRVSVSAAEYGLLAASDSAIETAPIALRLRFASRRIPTRSFHEYLLLDVFDARKVRDATDRLASVDRVNSDRHPIAFFNTLLVWAEIQGGRIPAFLEAVARHHGQLLALSACGLIVLFIILRRTGRAVEAVVMNGGFTAMSFSVILLLLFQTAYGSVFERVGLFTATFMAGSAAGALLPPAKSPLARLRLIEGAAALGLLAAAFFPAWESALYLLNILSGTAAGALFAAAVQYQAEGDAADRSGRFYGLDLAGAFLGALLTAILLVPLAGMGETILLLAALKTGTFVLLLAVREGRA